MKKLVLHLQQEQPEAVSGALRMISNFTDMASAGQYQAVLLVTGAAVKQFQSGSPLFDAIIQLANKAQVTIKLCHNALRQHDIDEKSLNSKFEIVPAGIYELVCLQQAGYAYVKA